MSCTFFLVHLIIKGYQRILFWQSDFQSVFPSQMESARLKCNSASKEKKGLLEGSHYFLKHLKT